MKNIIILATATLLSNLSYANCDHLYQQGIKDRKILTTIASGTNEATVLTTTSLVGNAVGPATAGAIFLTTSSVAKHYEDDMLLGFELIKAYKIIKEASSHSGYLIENMTEIINDQTGFGVEISDVATAIIDLNTENHFCENGELPDTFTAMYPKILKQVAKTRYDERLK